MREWIVAAGIAILSGAASAQSVPQQSLGNWSSAYPGAIYLAPQDSAFVAPGIYRSLAPMAEFSSPMEISQICTRDFRETVALKSLFSGVSEAAGITDVIHKNYAAKLTGINLSAIKLEGNLEFKDETTFNATPLRVLSSDDDISDVILKNIGSSCRDIIAALTTPADFGFDYGYMWWRATERNETGRMLGSDAYFALGYRGQVLAVVPSRDLVIVQLADAATNPRGIRPAETGALLRKILAAAPPRR